ncbi:MAG: DUF4252 domain-containing protein [Bacteroidales bacterium]|jgi:hypothetical protein|nr:DUF4252 domain-containing protein [Bacteroidales bacterium]
MKKLIFSLAILAFLMAPFLTDAQSPLDKIVEKYSGQDGYTTVNITKEMFQMFQQIATGDSKDTNDLEIKKMMDQLTGLKVLTFKFDSTRIVKGVAAYNEFAGLFPSSVYKELMTINEGRQYIKFLTKQDGAGKISEMVMLMKDKSEVAVLSITGNIDLSTISKLSKGMNIHGMEGLGKIKQAHDKN